MMSDDIQVFNLVSLILYLFFFCCCWGFFSEYYPLPKHCIFFYPKKTVALTECFFVKIFNWKKKWIESSYSHKYLLSVSTNFISILLTLVEKPKPLQC